MGGAGQLDNTISAKANTALYTTFAVFGFSAGTFLNICKAANLDSWYPTDPLQLVQRQRLRSAVSDTAFIQPHTFVTTTRRTRAL